MSLLSTMSDDLDDILSDIGVDVVVRFQGAPVKTVNGWYVSDQEVVSPFENERALTKPVVALTESDAAGITREHTLQPAGIDEMRIYGEPQPAAGLVKFFLSKLPQA